MLTTNLNLPTTAFFFGGYKKENAFIARMEFRGTNRKPQAWFDFFLKEKEFVGLKKLPGEEKEGFQFGMIEFGFNKQKYSI